MRALSLPTVCMWATDCHSKGNVRVGNGLATVRAMCVWATDCQGQCTCGQRIAMVRAVCVWAMDCHGKGNGLPRSSRLQGRRKVARIGGARTAAVHHSLLVTC